LVVLARGGIRTAAVPPSVSVEPGPAPGGGSSPGTAGSRRGRRLRHPPDPDRHPRRGAPDHLRGPRRPPDRGQGHHADGTLSDLAYSYTKPGTTTDTNLRQSTTDRVTGRTTTYGYDELNRLTHAGAVEGTRTADYAYDKNGPAGRVPRRRVLQRRWYGRIRRRPTSLQRRTDALRCAACEDVRRRRLAYRGARADPLHGRRPLPRQEWIDTVVEDARTAGASVEVFDYPGSGHLFTDPGPPDEYDEQAAALLWPCALRPALLPPPRGWPSYRSPGCSDRRLSNDPRADARR